MFAVHIVMQLHMLPCLLRGFNMVLLGANTAVYISMFAFSPHIQEYPLLPNQEQH